LLFLEAEFKATEFHFEAVVRAHLIQLLGFVKPPPMDYLIKLRLSHAVNLLESTDKKIIDNKQ